MSWIKTFYMAVLFCICGINILHADWDVQHVGFESVTVQQVYSTGSYEFATLLNREGIYRRAVGSSEWIQVASEEICSQATPYFFKMGHCGSTVYTNAQIISYDSGKTWEEYTQYPRIEDLLYCDGRLLMSSSDTIFYTENGENWTRAFVGAKFHSTLSKAGDLLFSSYYGGLRVSRDLGETWKDISGGLPERSKIGSVVQINDNALMVTTENGLYWSSLYKFHWYSKKLFSEGAEITPVRLVDRFVTLDSTVYGFSTEDFINKRDLVYRYEYYDGAVHATPLYRDVEYEQFDVCAFGNELAVAGYNGVHILDADGRWRIEGAGFKKKPRVKSIYEDTSRVFAISDEGNRYHVHRSLDGGKSWDSVFAAYDTDRFYVNGDTVKLFGPYGSNDTSYCSYDGGDTWTALIEERNQQSNRADSAAIRPDKILWKGGDRVIGYSMDLVNNGKVAVHKTYLSEDGGKTYEFATGILGGVREIADNGNGVLLGERYNDLAHSADSGKSWIILEGEKPRNLLAYHKNIIFAEIEKPDEWDFVYGYSLDLGKTWQPLLDTAWDYFYSPLFYRFQHGKATIIRDGLIYVRDVEEIGGTAILDHSESTVSNGALTVIPRNKGLHIQLYNNTETTFKTGLYSLQGRELLTKSGLLPVGVQQIELDGLDLSTGVYFLKTSLNDRLFVQKIRIQ